MLVGGSVDAFEARCFRCVIGLDQNIVVGNRLLPVSFDELGIRGSQTAKYLGREESLQMQVTLVEVRTALRFFQYVRRVREDLLRCHWASL